MHTWPQRPSSSCRPCLSLGFCVTCHPPSASWYCLLWIPSLRLALIMWLLRVLLSAVFSLYMLSLGDLISSDGFSSYRSAEDTQIPVSRAFFLALSHQTNRYWESHKLPGSKTRLIMCPPYLLPNFPLGYFPVYPTSANGITTHLFTQTWNSLFFLTTPLIIYLHP